MSRRKGMSYENKICKILSKWSGEQFVRRGVGFSDKDILTPEWFGWSIECKKVEGIRPQDLLKTFPLSGSLKEYWEQADSQAKADNKKPMLVFSKNHEGVDYVVIRRCKAIDLLESNAIPHAVVLAPDKVYYVVVTLQELTKLDVELFKCS